MQEKYPLVSVLIPCYNHEKFLLDTLNSIIQDDYPNKEIIIINDGSKDRSDELIRAWILAHENVINIKYVYRQNAGVCKTLNELVAISSGEFLVPIASDDLLCKGSIKHRVDFLNLHPNKLVLISDAEVIDENNNVIMKSAISDYNRGDKKFFKDDSNILVSTLERPQISGPTVMMRKKIFEIVGQYKENLIAEDWYFYQRAAARNMLIFDNNISGQYRIHSSNASGKQTIGSAKMARTIILTYCYNWNFISGIKYKIIATKELFKWCLRFIYYKIK